MNELVNPHNISVQIEDPPVPVSPEQEMSLSRLETDISIHKTSGIEIGKELNYLKSITPHGHFGQLVEWRFGLKASQRCNYMRVAKVFGNQNCGNRNFSNEVLSMLLEAPEPEKALEEAQDQGESITVKQAKKIAELHKAIEKADEEISEAMEEVCRANRSERIADKAIIIANEVRNEIQEKYTKLQNDYETAVDEGARKVIRQQQRELDQLKIDLADQIRKEMSEAIERRVRQDLDGSIKASNKRAFTAEREADRHKQRAAGLADDNLYERSRAEKLEAELNAALPVEKDSQHARSLSFVLSDIKSIFEKITNDCESHQREQSDIKVRELIEAAQAYLGSASTLIDI